jgi:D-alanyl-D-alanine carboxypeptidase
VTSLESQLQALVALGVPGVVAVTARGEGAAGVADLEAAEPMTMEHRFRIGSVTKTFVAVVVLQLVDEGKLSLDDEAAPLVEGVTLRQLLNHTSGLPEFYDDLIEVFEPYREDPGYRWPAGERELLAQVLAKPRLFAPGESWSYSNSNYLVLGVLVEAVTDSPLADELRRRIFEPAGLTATEYVPGTNVPGLARGYLPPENPFLPGAGRPLDATDLALPFAGAAGGIVSTARDVARGLAAILGGDLLAPHLRAELLDAVASDWDESDRYGLGIEEVSAVMGGERSPCGPAWGHFGFGFGYTTIALASADGARQVVICMNGLVLAEEAWELLGGFVWRSYCV